MIKTQEEINAMILSGNCRNSDKLGKALTEPELLIVSQLLAGYDTQSTIGQNMGLSQNTVRNHITSICDKLDLNSTVSILAYAYHVNLLMNTVLAISYEPVRQNLRKM